MTMWNLHSAKARGLFLFLLALGLLSSIAVWAALSEPDNVFWGGVSRDGVPLTEAVVTVTRDGSSEVVAEYALGSNEAYGSKYVALIPIDSVDPQTSGRLRPGDQLLFYVDGELAGRAAVEERGTPIELDLDRAFNDVDLSITSMAAMPSPVIAGSEVTYAIEVANAGPADEPEAGLTVTLPAGLVYSSAAGALCSSPAAGTLDCSIGTVVVNGSVTVSLTFSTDPSLADGSTLSLTARTTHSALTVDTDSTNDTSSLTSNVSRLVDLEVVELTPTSNPFVAGQGVSFNATFRNRGPSVVSGTGTSFSFPVEITAVSVLPTTGTCGVAPQAVSCTTGEIGPGGTFAVVIGAEVSSSAADGASLSVSATVTTAGEVDTDTSNNSLLSVTPVQRQTDLAVTSTAAPATVTAGTSAQWSFDLTNQGPSDEPSATLDVTVPSSLTGVSVDPATACSVTSGQVQCTFGTLAALASRTVTLTATVRADAPSGGTVTVTATAGALYDTDPSNDAVTASTVIDGTVDLALAVSDSPDPVRAGEQLAYQLTVDNLGTSRAVGVTLTQNLPAEFSLVSTTVTPLPVFWSLDVSGDALHEVDPLTGATTRTVSLTLPGATITGGHGLAYDATSGVVYALVSLAGQTGHELVQVDAGSGALIALGDTGDRFVGLAADDGGRLFTMSPESPSVAPAETLHELNVMTAQATALWSLADGGSPGEAIAWIDGALYHATGSLYESVNPDTGDRTPHAVGGASYQTPLALAATLGNGVFLTDSGQSILMATDPMAPSFSAVGSLDHVSAGLAYAPRASCQVASGVMTCSLGSIDPGATTVVTVTGLVDPAATGILNSAASVTSSLVDADSSNDTDVPVETSVTAQSDLEIALSTDVDPVAAGSSFVLTASVTNQGPSTATNAVATIDLDPAVAGGQIGLPAGCTSAGGGQVTCQVASLDVAAVASFEITLPAPPELDDGSSLTMTAAVTADSWDPVQPSDASVTIGVERQVDLAVALTTLPDPIQIGDLVTATVVLTNEGPSLATGVTLDHTFDSHMVLVSATPSKGTCSGTAALSCDIGTLAPAETVTVVVELQLDWAITDTASLTLQAGATSTEPEVSGAEGDNSLLVVLPLSAYCSLEAGCFQWEFLAGERIQLGVMRFSWRVTNRCAEAADRVDFRFRPGVTLATAMGTTYTAPSGRQYALSPVGISDNGLRFTALSEGLANNASDVFTVDVMLDSLGQNSEFWNLAANALGEVGAREIWSTCYVPRADLAVVDATACADHRSPPGYMNVDVTWSAHVWAPAGMYDLYRLEEGNPTPIKLNSSPLTRGPDGTVTFRDVLDWGPQKLLPTYRIVPLAAGSGEVQSEGIVEVLSEFCGPFTVPAVGGVGGLLMVLGLGIGLGRRKRRRS